MLKRISCLFLCLFILAAGCPGAFAAEAELGISTAAELMDFAEKCRLDSYSRGLKVKLEADIDLSGTGFFSIPSFSGEFDGCGHTIKGLEIDSEGSVQGLFRYVESGGTVKNLVVQGTVKARGSKASIGGIAGSNSGLIINSRFEGSVSGGDRVGGIAGSNTVKGIIENCMVSGEVGGLHFVGGVAGDNSGVIRSCENRAAINTTETENTVDLTDITVETMMSSEAANTATDIGGIAGINCGFIRHSVNRGNVGYKSMGYNVGGIAGSHSGYMLSCENHGSIMGRKDTGGIVGQLEPVAYVEFTADTLQILQGQMNSLGGTVNQASANVQSAGSSLGSEVDQLQSQVKTAEEAIKILADQENSDPDSIQAAQSALTDSLQDMQQTALDMGNITVGAMNSLTGSLNAIQGQINAVGATVGNAAENLGGEIKDVSDKDTPSDTTAKIESCANYGAVSAEYNVGGVTGTVAPSNDLDAEDNYSFGGNTSMNFEGELRAVILSSRNEGEISGKKQNVGGIAGLQSMGLVRGCVNRGAVQAESAEAVGGISGRSGGFIRSCSANCVISGDILLGGIAGSATVVSSCRSLVMIEGGREKVGEVLGEMRESEEEKPVRSNYYLSVAADRGAIDGISYDGWAQPLTLKKFLELKNLDECFKTVQVSFISEVNGTQVVDVPLGGSLTEIPAVPEKAHYTGEWGGLADARLDDLRFDMSFEAVYIGEDSVLESSQQRKNGLPILLMQGSFTSKAELTLEDAIVLPAVGLGERVLEIWDYALSPDETVSKGRYLLPEDCDGKAAEIMLCMPDGQWVEVESELHGSYLVFETDGAFTGICLKQTARNLFEVLLTAGGITVIFIFSLAALLVTLVIRQKKGDENESANL